MTIIEQIMAEARMQAEENHRLMEEAQRRNHEMTEQMITQSIHNDQVLLQQQQAEINNACTAMLQNLGF